MAYLYQRKLFRRRRTTEETLATLGVTAEEIRAFRERHDQEHPEVRDNKSYYEPVLETFLKGRGIQLDRFSRLYQEKSAAKLNYSAYEDVRVRHYFTVGEALIGRVEGFALGRQVLYLRDKKGLRKEVPLHHKVLKGKLAELGVREGDDILIVQTGRQQRRQDYGFFYNYTVEKVDED